MVIIQQFITNALTSDDFPAKHMLLCRGRTYTFDCPIHSAMLTGVCPDGGLEITSNALELGMHLQS